MGELVYIWKVKPDGTLMVPNKEAFQKDMADFAGQEDVMIRVAVKKAGKRTRTTQQNGFYWNNFLESQAQCFLERWGERYTKNQMHQWNKDKFWGEDHFIEETGEVVTMPAETTTNFSTTEWEEKLENIRHWFLRSFDWILPYPEKQEKFNYNK